MSEYDYLYKTLLNFKYDPRDKDMATMYHIRYMLARTQSMFRYSGLPDTIPARVLELYLQTSGYCGMFEFQDNLYCGIGGLGGVPDYNYMPTVLTISNPALNLFKTLHINKDVIVIKSDSMYTGLLPLLSRYGNALTENELSMFLVSINTRIQSLISASDDRTKASAELYLRRVEDGDTGIIGDVSMFENLRVHPYATASSSGYIKNLIEYEQYLKASEYNELGLDANYNMKRETLTDSENEMNRDSLLPLIDDMLACRKEGITAVNDMFGTNITVSLNSAWEDNAEELELTHEHMKQDVEDMSNDSNTDAE